MERGADGATAAPATNEPLQPLSARETLAVLRDVLLPLAARGMLARRPRVAGRNVVLFVISSLLANLLAAAEFHQLSPAAPRQSEPLPATLSPFDLRFEVEPPQ